MGSEQNPLQISLILSEIFRKLTVKDQKNFRLVSKTWRDSTLGYWRSSSALVVISSASGSEKDFVAFLQRVKKGKDQFHRIEEYPFRQFKIVERVYILKNDKIRFQTDEEETFDQLVGHDIEYMEFKFCQFESPFMFETLKWILNLMVNLKELVFNKLMLKLGKKEPNEQSTIKLPAAENLKSLKIFRIFYHWTDGNFQRDKIQADFAKILHIVPNLKNLTLDTTADQLLHSFAVHAPSAEKQIKLERLILENCVFQPQVFTDIKNYLEVVKPPLKELRGEITIEDREEQAYHQFLEASGKTLTTLNLRFGIERTEWFTDLTGRAFPNLTHFHLTFNFNKWDSKSIGKFDFEAFRGMPSLQSFICVTSHNLKEINETLSMDELQFKGSAPWVGTQVVQKEEIEMNQMREFHYSMRNKFGVESLMKIGSWMKNLKRLSLVLDEKAFEIIQEVFPALEEIILLEGSTVGEDAIEKVRAARSSLFIRVKNNHS